MTLAALHEYLYKHGLTGPHEEVREPDTGANGWVKSQHGGYIAVNCVRCGAAFIRAARGDAMLCGKPGC